MNRVEVNVRTGEETVIALTAEEIAHLQEQAAIPVVPREVPMWAAQAALKQAGKYDLVDAYMLSDAMKFSPAYFAWTMGNFASRNSAFIAGLKGAFGLSDSDVDAIFVAAQQIAQVAG